MQSFRNFGESDDPWFRVGDIAVTTTTFVSAISVVYMFVWAFEEADRPLTTKLMLSAKDFGHGSVLGGQIWRLITWPIPIDPDIWTLILVVIFWMLGSQLEAIMGRRRFTGFLIALTVVPALVMTVLELAGVEGIAFGLRFLELGVLVAFAAHFPTARFWPGIPAWGIAGIIVGIEALQAIDVRSNYQLILLFTVTGFALVLIRALGHAEELDWLPKLPLPAGMGGDPHRRSNNQRQKPKRQQTRGSHLSSIPAQPSVADLAAQADIDALLDKVAEQGMDSLTKAERRALEEHSKRLRKRRGEA